METLTIAEAAEATGLTKKAVRNRVDRGQLRAVLRDGVRRIPQSELERAGLFEAGTKRPARQRQPEAAPSEAIILAQVVRDLVTKVETQAAELATLRALTQEAESVAADHARLQAELFETRAEVTQLKAQRKPRLRWLLRAT